ncbi:MAG: hypothetical protein JXR11_10015 [Balneola sp.]
MEDIYLNNTIIHTMAFPNSYEYLNLSLHLKYEVDDFEETLKGLKNILTHFKNEVEFWEQDFFFNHGTFNNYSRFFREKYDLVLNFYEINKETEKEPLEKSWDSLSKSLKSSRLNLNNRNNVPIISYQTPTAVFYENLIKQDPNEATLAFYYLNEIPHSIGNNLKQFDGIIKAYEYKQSRERGGFKERRKAERISVSRLLSSVKKESNKLENRFSTISTDIELWFKETKSNIAKWEQEKEIAIKKSITDGQNKLALTDKTYSDYMALKAPLKYWEERVEQYGNSGYLWSLLLAVSIIVICGGILKLIYDPPKIFDSDISTFDPIAIKSILLYATLISFSAYFLRTCSRMIFSSFHLKRDAEERHQLTMVYLSLKERGDISEDERDLIIQAIFSRVDTGLLKGDNAPTMPGASSFLERIASK